MSKYFLFALIIHSWLHCSAQKKHTINVKINVPGCSHMPVKSVKILPDSIELVALQTKHLQVEILPDNATNKKVTWATTNTQVAQVDSFGMVTAKNAGTAFIIATADDGNISDSVLVSVKQLVTDLDQQYLNQINIYPNPINNKNLLCIESNYSSKIIISSISGKILISDCCDKKSCYIDIKNLSSGQYIIRVQNEKYNINKTLIIN